MSTGRGSLGGSSKLGVSGSSIGEAMPLTVVVHVALVVDQVVAISERVDRVVVVAALQAVDWVVAVVDLEVTANLEAVVWVGEAMPLTVLVALVVDQVVQVSRLLGEA